jgi:hypothetical protein
LSFLPIKLFIKERFTIQQGGGADSPRAILMKVIVATDQDWLTPVISNQILVHDNA